VLTVSIITIMTITTKTITESIQFPGKMTLFTSQHLRMVRRAAGREETGKCQLNLGLGLQFLLGFTNSLIHRR